MCYRAARGKLLLCVPASAGIWARAVGRVAGVVPNEARPARSARDAHGAVRVLMLVLVRRRRQVQNHHTDQYVAIRPRGA